MITPSSLQNGDTVAIVSTARKVSIEELKPALQLLESWGLKAILGKTVGAEENQFAGHDGFRALDFQTMLDNPDIKAIWCARGGYGTVRMIDKLDFSTFKKHPKWIVGYSDVTVLHSHIHNLGVETVHAQMCLEIEKKSEETRESLRKVLFGEEYSISFETDTYKEAFSNTLRQAQHNALQEFNRVGLGKGELVGGNLSVLYSLCGSNSAINTDGKILFIEDLDEYLYHIDRMMMNLKRNGRLENLAGLIVGGMTKMNDNTIPFGKTAKEIIWKMVKDYNYPVCFDFPTGHIEDNRALIMGREVELNIQSSTINVQF
ncbi:MAG: S66 peptidase family protein [Aequorivita sp.]